MWPSPIVVPRMRWNGNRALGSGLELGYRGAGHTGWWVSANILPMDTTVEALTAEIRAFRDARDWLQFHNPAEL